MNYIDNLSGKLVVILNEIAISLLTGCIIFYKHKEDFLNKFSREKMKVTYLMVVLSSLAYGCTN